MELFDLICDLKDNPYLVFNGEEMFRPLMDLRTKLNLFASQKVLDEVEPLFEKIKEVAYAYWDKYDGPEFEQYRENRMMIDGATELDIEHEIEQYQDANVLSSEYIDERFAKIVAAMRKDMGAKSK